MIIGITLVIIGNDESSADNEYVNGSYHCWLTVVCNYNMVIVVNGG